MTRMKKRHCRVLPSCRNSRILRLTLIFAVISSCLIVILWSRVLVPVSKIMINNSTTLTFSMWSLNNRTGNTSNKTLFDTISSSPLPHPQCEWIGPALPHVNFTTHGIPFILHQIYSSEEVPEQYAKLIHGCQKMNPNFIHFLWTDNDAHAFVETFYPDKKSLFSQYKMGVQKSDFLRILLLYHFGGVYIDMDVECIQPFHSALDRFNSSCILDRERELQTRLRWNRNSTAMNSAMMTRPKHPFFKYLLDKLPESLKQKHVMWRTGPFFLDDRLKEYNKLRPSGDSGVTLAPSSAFSPSLDQGLISLFKKKCSSFQLFKKNTIRGLGCDEWKRISKKKGNKEDKNAILVHRFLHLAYSGYKKNIVRRQNLCSSVPPLKRFRSVQGKP